VRTAQTLVPGPDFHHPTTRRSAVNSHSLRVACAFADYCAEGSPSAMPCPAGTRKDPSLELLTREEHCLTCPEGTACSVGSEEPQLCLPGTFGSRPGLARCELCPAGKFTSVSGSTACHICTIGYLCVEGSSAPQPCPGGTHANQEVLESVGFLSNLTSDCVVCPPGTSWSVGSAQPSDCLPGSFNAAAMRPTCALCPAGKFTPDSRSTACRNCTLGYLCIVGSSAPQVRNARDQTLRPPGRMLARTS
jgi:hypothetical protein